MVHGFVLLLASNGSFMSQFFEKRDRWNNGLGLWVIVAMCFVTPLAWWAVKQIKLHNDVENWLPSDDPQSKILRWYKEHFASLDENGDRRIEERVLLSWEGSALHDPRVDKFVENLDSPYFGRVVTPKAVMTEMVKLGVKPDDAIARLEGVLVGTGPLKLKLTDVGAEKPRKVITMLTDAAHEQLNIEIIATNPLPSPEVSFDDMDFSDDDSDENAPDRELTEAELLALNVQAKEQAAIDALDAAITARWKPHEVQVSWNGMHGQPEVIQQFIALAKGLRTQPTPSGESGNTLVQDCFFVAGSPVAMSVVLTEQGIADRGAAFADLRRAVKEAGVEDSMLHMGGRPVAGHALNENIGKTGWNTAYSVIEFHKRSPVLFSLLAGVVLCFVMLRSPKLATLVIIAAIYTMFISVAVVPATGGSMNMVVVVMPTLLMVLTMSASIHVCNYWKHAAHRDIRTAVVEATKMAKWPCSLAAFTTSIGLLSLATSPLAPVRDFGVYSAIGCLISLVVVLFCLPAMLQYFPAKPPKSTEVNRENWHRLGQMISAHWKLVSVTCLGVFIACTAGLQHFRTETKVIRYFPDDSRVVQDYNFLENNLSGIIPVDIIVKFEESIRPDENFARAEMDADESNGLTFLERQEIVRRITDKIRGHREISGALSLPDFQPIREPKPDFSELSALGRVQASLKMRGYNEINDQTRTQIRASSAKGGAAHSFYVLASEAADLETVGDGKINKAGDELWRITAQVAIMSDLDYGDLTNQLDAIVQSELKYHPGSSHHVTGMVPLFLRTQQAVLDSLIGSFRLAFLVIAAVMILVLRHPLSGLIAMLPNLMPVGVVFGLISWAGLAVDIGTMITASVALGIAVDGTLHLLKWFRESVEDGLDRKAAVSAALSHCGPAMWQTSAAVGVGLSMLYWADLLLISRFGWLMAALIGVALIADVILLPALLAGWLGRLIERTVHRQQAQQATASSSIGQVAPRPHIASDVKQSRVAEVD